MDRFTALLWIVWIKLVTPGPNHKPFKHNLGARMKALLDQDTEFYFAFNSFRQAGSLLPLRKLFFPHFKMKKVCCMEQNTP